MSAGTDIYTTLGLTKIRDAAGSGAKVKIKWVAVGDAQGAAYDPLPSQTALRRERLRTEITRAYPVGDDAWYVSASFPTDAEETTVREMGFFDEDGDLIALWAGADVNDARKTGTIEYLIGHWMVFSGIQNGVVVMDAPLDTYLDHAVLKLTTDALILDRQLAQCKQLRDLERAA